MKLQVLKDSESLKPERHARSRSAEGFRRENVVLSSRSSSAPPAKRASDLPLDSNKENWDPVRKIYTNLVKPKKKRSTFKRKPLADITQLYQSQHTFSMHQENVESSSLTTITTKNETKTTKIFDFEFKVTTKSSRFKIDSPITNANKSKILSVKADNTVKPSGNMISDVKGKGLAAKDTNEMALNPKREMKRGNFSNTLPRAMDIVKKKDSQV